ncbi:AraC family transcriptional regulator [Cupriavidus gilardii]|uniref:AraC family transcriptional regulator n=1 Tax=Cupriavidus gilardii TaxID=82541 RepID=UPI0021B41984|nr:AraC family transcriptional regulator [Cupriavidus gilardii]MCT9115580.1 AraC family transcriptional regulator [Cupriavidus gilardii]UXC38623.1 AraC family transcriptional regulator [Cupriavidus gilardii]
MTSTATPVFWRDPSLSFIEARWIEDGRRIRYGVHSHETFSIGAVTGGRSIYVGGRMRAEVGAGAVVLMNPEEVHACNPLDDAPWSYRMLHVDAGWLGALQHDLGFDRNSDFQAFSTRVSDDAALHRALGRFHALLTDEDIEPMRKEEAAIAFFSAVHRRLLPAPRPRSFDTGENGAHRQWPEYRLRRAAEFIDANFARPLRLGDICATAQLSESHLIRAFKQHYGLTPHAYLVNRRVQYSRSQLKRGRAISDVALEAGFADQAHLQRVFKRMVAATPAQYQRMR